MSDSFIKVGAIIFNDQNQVLAVHKRGKPSLELIVPGGKREPFETDEATLNRELIEELNATILTMTFYGEFQDKAIYEESWLIMRVYKVKLLNSPTPCNEIDKLVWLDKNYRKSHYIFASILGKQILPKIFNGPGNNHGD